MKSFKELFKDFENKCIDEFQYKRASLIAEYNNYKPIRNLYSVDPLFYNDDLTFYSKINFYIKDCLHKNIKTFLKSIFENKGIEVRDEDDFLIINDYAIYLKSDFNNSSKQTHDLINCEYFINENNMKVYLVFICKNTRQSQISIAHRKIMMDEIYSDKIKFCTLSDFIGEKFSEKYEEIFDKLVINFEKKLKDEIGYQITEICNSRNMKKFRSDCKNIFLNFTYEPAPLAMPTKPLNPNDFNTIYDEFINKEKYKIMLSDYDFSDSFITSEWLFEKYKPSQELDNTYIVAGYLKSLEQLLTAIIWKIGKGKTIKGLNGYHEIKEENIGVAIDCTLGNLEHFISNGNKDLYLDEFRNKNSIVDYLNEQLNKWKKNYRNGYFHKDNLKDITKVKEIRDETIYLYFMILGSFKINAKDF